MLRDFALVFLLAHGALAITGGRNAGEGQFPFLVGITNAFDAYYCGASIVNNRWVVTAAQCMMDESSPSNVKIHAGSTLIATGTRYDVQEIRMHPSFSPATLANDIAVLQTSRPMTFNEFVQPIPLIAREFDGDEMQSAGWGRASMNGPYQTDLQYINTFAISYAQCYNRIEINQDNICAFQGIGIGICVGDSGTGFEVIGEGLGGVASFIVEGCAVGNPDGIASIPYHRAWIISNTN